MAARITKDDFVIEIGPGIGSLTQFLCDSAKSVCAIEIDKNLIPILGDTLGGYSNIKVINEDVLKLDLNGLIAEEGEGKKAKLAANLPYYITTPIIMELLEKHADIESMTVMVQKEVADRMQALPGTKDYGALSVAVQFYCDTHIDFIVPPSCFMPKPNVDSAVITLTLRQNRVSVKDEALMFRIIKCAFGQRRKTLLNGIYNLGGFNLSKEDITGVLEECGLDPKVRGESLSISQFAELSDIFGKILKI